MKESPILREIILRLSNSSTRLFRMQAGTFELIDGRHITIGVPGMSDLIGLSSRVITPEMVGQRIAFFTAIEVKSATGRPRPNQLDFIQVVSNLGGLAGVARSVDDARRILTL